MCESSKNQLFRFTQALPPEMIRECILRLPISYQPIAAMVTKDLRGFISNRQIFKMRAKRNHFEATIYMGVLSSSFHKTDWFSVCKKPLANNYVLRPVPGFPLSLNGNKTLVTAGSKIYAIDGEKVFCVNCVDFKVSDVADLNRRHSSPQTAVLDDKLFVIGGCKQEDSEGFLESLNILQPDSQWDMVKLESALTPINLPAMCHKIILGTSVYFINNKGAGLTELDLKKLTFSRKDEAAMGDYDFSTSCVINTRLYAFNKGRTQIMVYKHEQKWARVKGLKNLPKFGKRSRLLNCGGVLLVVDNSEPTKIFITSVTLKDMGGDLWGVLESSNLALELPHATSILHILEVQL